MTFPWLLHPCHRSDARRLLPKLDESNERSHSHLLDLLLPKSILPVPLVSFLVESVAVRFLQIIPVKRAILSLFLS